MEDNGYRAGPPWDVTTGLLTKDLITGKRQVGDSQFETHLPAEVNIAGDANDLNGPVYRSFKGLLSNGPIPVGWTITQTVNRAGQVGDDPSLASRGVTVDRLLAETNHTVASVFARFMDQYSGVPYGNAYYLTGFPITEAYWTTVKVGGVARQVLVQAFERRVLTFTPDNPAGWQVEMGNVGQHYREWLYGPSPLPAAIGFTYDDVVSEPDGRIVAHRGEKIVARAMRFEGTNPWQWVGEQNGTGYLLDYTPREYADALGMRAGSNSGGWLFADAAQLGLFEELCNIGTIDSGLYWKEVEPQQGVFNFSSLDRQIELLQNLCIPIRGHALIFPNSQQPFFPDWLVSGKFSSDQLRTAMVNHITQIVDHCKGRVDQWVVVNEPYAVSHGANDMFYNIIGLDYIDTAFQAARAADPSAKLILADTDNHHSRGELKMSRYAATALYPKGLMDYLGFEMHSLDVPWIPGGVPTADDVTQTIKSFGVPGVVTEFDYDISNFQGTEAQRLQRQSDVYRRLVQASFDAGVKEITFWTLGDSLSWRANVPGAEPTMFVDPEHPKPAYAAVRDVFRQQYLATVPG